MPAMIIERTEENKQEYANSICEYQGISYFVLKNITNGKCFIEVDGERKYLDKNGCVANKQPGKRNVKEEGKKGGMKSCY